MRYELSETEWAAIRVMLRNKPRGLALGDNRWSVGSDASCPCAQKRAMVLCAQNVAFTASSGITEHRRRTGCDFSSVASNATACSPSTLRQALRAGFPYVLQQVQWEHIQPRLG